MKRKDETMENDQEMLRRQAEWYAYIECMFLIEIETAREAGYIPCTASGQTTIHFCEVGQGKALCGSPDIPPSEEATLASLSPGICKGCLAAAMASIQSQLDVVVWRMLREQFTDVDIHPTPLAPGGLYDKHMEAIRWCMDTSAEFRRAWRAWMEGRAEEDEE
jgi:hypothetical protein